MKTEYIILIAAILIAAGLIAFAWIKRNALIEWLKKPETRELIARLCREAERVIIGTKQGAERLAWVVSMLYKYIPANIIPYIPQEMLYNVLVKVINIVFDQIAVMLEDGTRMAL